jgi:two-component system cell cycle sensor histidine kinase/response regulator CckA
MGDRVRILLIEDDPADARLIRELLADAKGMTFHVASVATLAAGLEHLATVGTDVVLLDLGLPDSVGLETVRRFYAKAGSSAVLIVLSIVADEELAVQAVQLGAQDYLIKGLVDTGVLVRSLRYALERSRAEEALKQARAELENRVRERTAELARAIDNLRAEIAERKQAEEALRASQRLLQGLIDNSTAVIYVKDPDGRYLLINRRFEELFHVTKEAIRGKSDFELFPKERAETYRAHELRVFEANAPLEWEEVIPQDDGLHTYISLKFPLHDAGGKAFATCGISTDITERKQLEGQLLQSQKLESIGRLAGGVAHDFNNLLTAILAYSEILMHRADDSLTHNVEQIKLAAERAARLTRQLLIFARRGVVEATILDLNELMLNLSHLLRRLIGEDMDLVVQPRAGLWAVRADAGQIEQVLVNLAVNARDAMPRGGNLTIEASNASVDQAHARERNMAVAGDYVRVTVSDTGTGMSEETKAHLFEPFFTTKEQGKGTGLGLATCHGIVRQSGGYIFCSSEVGKGTTFTVYLPRFQGRAAIVERMEEAAVLGGSETVLVVEDDPVVRGIAVRALRERGYRVLEAANGVDALRAAERHRERIDLVVTDLVMPRMGGKDLAEQLRVVQPDLRVLYTSGYTESERVRLGEAGDLATFLQKPFTGSTLARRVREALARG